MTGTESQNSSCLSFLKTGFRYVAQAGFELAILLPTSQCWDYRCAIAPMLLFNLKYPLVRKLPYMREGS